MFKISLWEVNERGRGEDSQWDCTVVYKIDFFFKVTMFDSIFFLFSFIIQDEMLIFMEYCDTGTIVEAAKAGLPEYLIRRYTRELCLAVSHLHENRIVHRDIKGHFLIYLNIFFEGPY